MKIILLIGACLLFSCSNNDKNVSEDIIVKTTFESILKDIHLAESLFEMNKKRYFLSQIRYGATSPTLFEIVLALKLYTSYNGAEIDKRDFPKLRY